MVCSAFHSLKLCNFCNRYLVDNHKLRQPTEKNNYTLCPYYVTHHSLAHVSEVTLTEAESSQAKLRWQTFVRTIPAYPSNKYYGKGIVSSASSGLYRCRRLIASIKLLRWMGCRLPVEVFMHPGELTADEIREFETVPGVTVRILKHNISQINSKTGSFAIKPASILHSSFEHVLWLDSDNIAVRDPEYLFDLPHYTRSTAMFWPDFWFTPGKNAIWKVLDVPCITGEYEQESGQILINKRLAWKALNLALYLNLDHTISRVLYGDKDTFRFSWKVLDVPFYFIGKFVGIGGFDYVKSNDKNKPNMTTQ
ncbi:unnamed protein product [Adineta steineri]|uniref:Uncharacterized protein n=1 Tax=Adineta steineri TaxID=433720 RepID=A0A815DIB6_9BILA|nr:unnamed protein product [Adineta steineri]CAF3721138.1 unnamed protein product [Adineta steineri]